MWKYNNGLFIFMTHILVSNILCYVMPGHVKQLVNTALYDIFIGISLCIRTLLSQYISFFTVYTLFDDFQCKHKINLYKWIFN